MVWPLVLFIFFSGLDVVGMNLAQIEEFQLFGDLHLEAWSFYYQFSSMTTQLFWVFNQAIPIWIACALIFFIEKPKNMIFVISFVILTSTFPFVGLVPYTLYFMITRSRWSQRNNTVKKVAKNVIRNWASIQNLLAGVLVALLSVIYVFGNSAAEGAFAFLAGTGGVLFLLVAVIAVVLGFCLITKLVLLGGGKILSRVAIAGILGFIVYIIKKIILKQRECKKDLCRRDYRLE